jgi:P27 family predicted phage terminase small subunit
MRGRKPTNTAIKLVTGNPGHRPLPEDEPLFQSKIPPCPLALDKIGKKTWDEKAKLLYDAGVLTEGDGETLAIYCRIWSQIVLLSAELKTPLDYMAYDIKINEDTGEEIKVNAKTNPLCVRLENLISEYKAYSALLGLDPANRSKIKTGKKVEGKKTGKERFF